MDTVNPYATSDPSSPRPTRRRTMWAPVRREEGAFAVRDALRGLPSVVYAVLVNGYVKIGYSTNLANRLAVYGVSPTDLLVVLPGGRAEERALHERFADDLMRGREWFRQSSQILAWVNTERARMGVPSLAWPVVSEELALRHAIAEAEAFELH